MSARRPDSADTLIALFRQLGAKDPEGWASSELRENIPQLARFCFLRRVWRGGIDPWRNSSALLNGQIQADRVKRMLALGVDPADLASLAAGVAYCAAFDVVMAIDEGTDDEGPTELPGWRLMETDPDGNLTGRVVLALHESLIETDPSGVQARDLLR